MTPLQIYLMMMPDIQNRIQTNIQKKTRGLTVFDIPLYSQNINGMDSNKFSALLEIMKDYQIILLQETHLTTADHTAYEIQLRAKGWESFWGHAQKEYKRPIGGVAIWLKKSLLTTGIVQSCTKIRQEQTRHILSIQLQCRGQQFVLSSVYMPQNNNQNKVQKCITALEKLARQYVVIWCGDFNFVEDTRDSSNLSKPQKTYAFTHMKWLKKINQTKLVQEASEHHLRSMQAFTHTSTRSPWIRRRLDRIYCSVDHMHYLAQVNVVTNTPCKSDHSPIASRIKLTHPVIQRPAIKERRRNRIPQQFLASPHYKEKFRAAMQSWISTYRASIASWNSQHWSKVKKHMTSLAISINKEYRMTYHSNKRHHQGISLHSRTELDHSLHKADAHILLPQRVQMPQVDGLVHQGRVTTSATACANILIDHYANMSQVGSHSLEIQQEILQAIPEEDKQIFPRHFMDHPVTITTEEILIALKKMKTTAPGEDGIRTSLYRAIKKEIAEILPEVFTDLIGDMHKQFLQGLIVPIYKGANTCEAINYRPITLLNTDYRLLQQILVLKLKGPLQELIAPSQTAFLPGRCISDNIWSIQLLPKYLQLQQRSAYFAVCDFSKAYDKIDRSLLLQLCDVLQVPSFLRLWISQVLSQTYARVYAKGAFSKERRFTAGVRQGDPASPYLYLLMGHLLDRYLQHRGIQLKIPRTIKMLHHQQGMIPANDPFIISSLQYADDNTVPLFQSQIPAFLCAMDRFESASGQSLNKNKTWLLPIGKESPQPLEIMGLKVVHSTKILGITIKAFTGEAIMDWDERVQSISAYCALLSSRLHSSFTKFSRLCTYKLPQEFYRAEVSPPPKYCLDSILQKLGTLLPSKGWRKDLFPATTKLGGLGCLPLKEHLMARELKWISQLFTLGETKIWIQLVWNILFENASHFARAEPEEIQALPTPLRTLIIFLYWERFRTLQIIRVDFPWIRALWRNLKYGYYHNHRDRVPAHMWTTYRILDRTWSTLEVPRPTPVTTGWIWKTTNIPLEDYTVKLGTQLLTHDAQDERDYRWKRWLQIIQDQRDSDSTDCRGTPPVKWIPLYKIFTPLSRLAIPSIYRIPFWEVTMNAVLTSERLHRDDCPCICHASPASPGRAHFFYHCPLTLSCYAQLFHQDVSDAQHLIRQIWMVRPIAPFPLDAWALICIASTYSVDQIRKKIYNSRISPSRQTEGFYQKQILQLCVSVMARYLHTLADGTPCMTSLHPLQWDIETHRWRISPLLSQFTQA